jgi:hypothetical protein
MVSKSRLNLMNLMSLKRKAKYAIFIPRRVTKTPKISGSVISDLFCIRFDKEWKTYFELLNIEGLISGNNSPNLTTFAEFVFFDSEGKRIGSKNVEVGKFPRQTVLLDESFIINIKEAASFSVFHSKPHEELDLNGSYLAERGYAGYKKLNSAIRGYVHGNLDAIAKSDQGFELLGNQGIIRRSYQVQHPLRGPARYEFFISNPCKRSSRILIETKGPSGKWREIERFTLNPRGSKIWAVEKSSFEPSFIRVKSRLYLGRPVVFRIAGQGIDVFHG